MTDIERFDDLVRSERYFTATLLPALLLYDGFRGLRGFLDMLDRKARIELDRSAQRVSRQGLTGLFSLDQVELIAEFHIQRDLGFLRKLHTAAEILPLDLDADKQKRDAPDLVIIVGDEMVVCEGKFFDRWTPKGLNRQLQSQRKQIHLLLEARPFLRAYRHVALLPVNFDREQVKIECDAVFTWEEIAQLAQDVLGPQHYVARRFRGAVTYYKKIVGDPCAKYYSGVLPLEEVRKKCREEGDRILVGHRDGEAGLRPCSFDYSKSKPWKWRWRDPPEPLGRIVEKNWIKGKRFLELIDEIKHRDGATDAQKRPANARNCSGILPLDALLEKCRTAGDSILVGHGDGEAGLRRTAVENINSKKWKWRDTHDESLGKIVARNWITGKRFLELIEGLRDGAIGPAAVGQTV